MIDISVEAGCNAAKFQMFSAKNMYPKSAGQLDWKDNKEEYSYDIYKAVEKFELPEEWIDKLISYCKKKEIDFISSVFDIDGLNIMMKKGMKVIKLSSYTITNIPLIEAAAKTKLPIIMSTGGATIGETEEAINTVIKYHNNLTILHCSIQYPTKLEDVNMGIMNTFAKAFPNVKRGYSDHTAEPSAAPVQAIYLGGTVIEKHITLDKNMKGPDHFFALEPDKLKKMVEDIRKAEIDYKNNNFTIDKIIYGSSEKICHEHEQYLRDFCYMTLFSKKNIKKGDTIKVDDIAILRAGKKKKGLEPKYLELFKENKVTASKDINFEDPIQWKLLSFDNQTDTYDKWNIVKKDLQNKIKILTFKEREIYFMSIGHNIGKESYGKKELFLRPVLVYRKLSKTSFVGIPLTSKEKSGNYYHSFSYIENKQSIAMFDNIRVLDIRRADYKSGVIKLSDFKKLKDKLNKFLNITPLKREMEHAPRRKLQKSNNIITKKNNNVK